MKIKIRKTKYEIRNNSQTAKAIIVFFSVLVIVGFSNGFAFAKDISDKLKDSVVYLQVAYYGYEQYQPWKNMDLSEGYAVGCAVDKNKVITIASAVGNAAFIQAKKFDKSDFVPAKILIVDYESNLALIELDANAIGQPLKPLTFSEKYKKGAGVNFYWLSSNGQMYNGRGFLDRVTVSAPAFTYSKILTFVAAGISETTNLGQLYCLEDKPIGIASMSGKDKEGDIIPAKSINRFLKDFSDNKYNGIAMKGFETSNLVDPATRKYLKLPENIRDGVYISQVHTIGTGCDVLQLGDVLLSIDGLAINPYGRYNDQFFGMLEFDNLITDKISGQPITFIVWRDGKQQELKTMARRFDVASMLVPYYEFDRQPQYAIIGGCIVQKLTRSYMIARGENWEGKVEPQLYDYLTNQAFKPTDHRKDIVVLSYCMPANINLGYHSLSQCVVDKINGIKIKQMSDITKALAAKPESKFIEIEFEMDKPTVVLDRSQLEMADKQLSKNYGIEKLMNIQ